MLEGRVQTIGVERPKARLARSSTPRWLDDQRTIGILFVLPALCILAFVVVYPFLSAIWMSFQNKMVGAPATFIGFGNYVELFGDRHFLKTIKNTLVYTGFAVGLKFLLGLGMAMVLAQPRRLDFIYRTILFVPWAVPTIVAALSFRWIYDDFSGLLNNFLIGVFGMTDVISWLGDPDYAMASVIAVVVWSGTPFYTMSFLAGLKAIPQEMYEAARIDGANPWQEFWHVTIPQMRKVFTVVVMLSTIWTSTNLVIVQILTNGGPANTTQILPNLAYKYALLASRLGIGSAVNMIFFPILAVLIYFLSRRMLSERE
ncbi:MAG: sugar ABC transporter permease [Alphaproteobacteria bacterium]|nr:sugar ABC transporter permease [Alphaproteobacteria bacterium]